ncbi:MAG: HD domain-containing phosphohydrolase [Pseudorhodoplanes sp.]
MQRIHIVSSWRAALAELRSSLSDHVAADYLTVEELPDHEPGRITILDVDFGRVHDLQAIQKWLRARPEDGQVVVAIDDKSSRLQLTQAGAIGATSVMLRPLTAEKLHHTLFSGEDLIPLAPCEIADDARDLAYEFNGLREIFAAAALHRTPELEATKLVSAQIVRKIAEIGLSDYLEIVRNHHNNTFQHCLCVTAVAVAFGLQLGFSRSDTEKVALAGLLHDVGKALVPVGVLEKPSELTKEETAMIRMHPEMGHQLLRDMAGLSDDILDMVLHHHEYLDGSGYPHGLKGGQISDLSRFITIADVYGALIERRAYRAAVSGAQAFRVLQAMGPKLDVALVREFMPVAIRLSD